MYRVALTGGKAYSYLFGPKLMDKHLPSVQSAGLLETPERPCFCTLNVLNRHQVYIKLVQDLRLLCVFSLFISRIQIWKSHTWGFGFGHGVVTVILVAFANLHCCSSNSDSLRLSQKPEVSS